MMPESQSARPRSILTDRILRAVGWLERVPHTVLAVPLRMAVATVFWNSAMTKLADWNAALELFREDYRLPFVAPNSRPTWRCQAN